LRPFHSRQIFGAHAPNYIMNKFVLTHRCPFGLGLLKLHFRRSSDKHGAKR
jgi:hypothetical protein